MKNNTEPIHIVETRDFQVIAGLNAGVQNLHAQLHPALFKPFNRPAMEEALQGFLKDPNCRCFIAKREDTVLGYVLCFIKESGENAFHYNLKSVYVDQIAVLEQYRGAGVGALLLQEAEKLARQQAAQRVELDHWTSNVVAARYFRKSGFELVKEKLYKLL